MVAPVTVKVVLCPEQIVAEEALTLSVGVVVTVTVTVLTVLVQPPVVPLTEYTVVEAGLTTLVAADPDGNQVYVVAPLAVKVVEVLLQIVVPVGVTVSTGVVPVVTVTVFAAPAQLPLEPVTV